MTFLSDLRATERGITENETLTLYVPGRDPLVAVRFRPPGEELGDTGRDRLSAVIAAVAGGRGLSRREENGLIVDCCDEILIASKPGLEAEVLSVEPEPLRFDAGDSRWEDECKTALECVDVLYCLRKRPMAASGHALRLVSWLQGLEDRVTEAVMAKGKAIGAGDN